MPTEQVLTQILVLKKKQSANFSVKKKQSANFSVKKPNQSAAENEHNLAHTEDQSDPFLHH